MWPLLLNLSLWSFRSCRAGHFIPRMQWVGRILLLLSPLEKVSAGLRKLWASSARQQGISDPSFGLIPLSCAEQLSYCFSSFSRIEYWALCRVWGQGHRSTEFYLFGKWSLWDSSCFHLVIRISPEPVLIACVSVVNSSPTFQQTSPFWTALCEF